jgi:hypothetical protein
LRSAAIGGAEPRPVRLPEGCGGDGRLGDLVEDAIELRPEFSLGE